MSKRIKGKAAERITMAHGSGGRVMHRLIDELFLKELGNSVSRKKNDAARINIGGADIAFTTDSFVVDPVFFPGGDIGSLAVHGTVNDLAVSGASAEYISLGLIIEEGFPMEDLIRITRSMKAASSAAGVRVATGDMKVVEKGACDGIFINSSGIGKIVRHGLSKDAIRPGDAVIVNGTIGDHAISILSKREGMRFGAAVRSDSAPLNGLIKEVLSVSRGVRFMRDPTRGGLATTLNEMTEGMRFGIALEEEAIPLSPAVRSACELLGLDPLYLACEGRAIFVAAACDEDKILRCMKRHKYGRGARAIGRVVKEHAGRVYVRTVSGGKRIADMLSGEHLPRIC